MLGAIHLAVSTIGWNHPILDQHGFRQTQTALTSWWMLHGSPFLRYMTPVLGPPWSIPMEFPLYQWIVARSSAATGAGLEVTGRFVSLTFFYIAVGAFLWMFKRLRVPPFAAVIFGVLVFSSPLYLFWARTFMIETTALAFAALYLAFMVAACGDPRPGFYVAAAVAGIAAALIKSPTFAGSLLTIVIVLTIRWWHERPARRIVWMTAFALVLPLVAGYWWIHFSDSVKLANPLQFLTAADLTTWNFGKPGFRFSMAFWMRIAIRVMPELLGGFWPLLALAVVLVLPKVWKRLPLPALACAAGFWGPTLTFSNLHYVHNYYQCATAMFLYASIALLGSLVPGRHAGRIVLALLVSIAIAGNESIYRSNYYPSVARENYPVVPAARFLHNHTGPDDIAIGYGLDWDSTVAYYSERKVIMDKLYRPIASAQMAESLNLLGPGEHVRAVFACDDARRGAYAQRVLDTVEQLGLSREARFDNGTCRVFLGGPATGAPPSKS